MKSTRLLQSVEATAIDSGRVHITMFIWGRGGGGGPADGIPDRRQNHLREKDNMAPSPKRLWSPSFPGIHMGCNANRAQLQPQPPRASRSIAFADEPPSIKGGETQVTAESDRDQLPGYLCMAQVYYSARPESCDSWMGFRMNGAESDGLPQVY